MTWFKLDDRFFENPKIAVLSPAAKLAYLEAGTYCARELTDGFVPEGHARRYAGKTAVVKELVPGLWEPCENGYQVHDYLQFNPTREKVLTEREAAQKRMKGVRSGNVRANKQPNKQPNIGRSTGEVRPSPVSRIPDPLSLLPLLQPRDEVSQVLRDWGTVGLMNAATVGDIEEDIGMFGLEWVQKAVARARGSGKSDLPWNYCHSTLEGWKVNGGSDEPKNERRTYGAGRAPAPVSVGDRFAARIAGR